MSTDAHDRDIEERVAQLHERIDDLERQQAASQSFDPREWLDAMPAMTRRKVIGAALASVGIAASTQTAMAQSTKEDIACYWLGNQDAGGYTLYDLGGLQFGDGSVIESLTGANLSVNANGELEAASGGGALSDDGSDTDGGNDYVLPQAADNIDLQSDGEIQNAQAVSTEKASITEDMASARLGSDQTISSNSITKIQYDTTIDNNLNIVDTSNNEIDIQDAGSYLFSPVVRWASDTGWSNGDKINLYIYINGSLEHVVLNRKRGTEEISNLLPPTVIDLASGDSVDFRVFQDSGASKTLRKGAERTFVSIGRIG